MKESLIPAMVRAFTKKMNIHEGSVLEPQLFRAEHRRDYLLEEIEELSTALNEDNLVGALDALGDIVYYAIGGMISWGADPDAIMSEIHASNMSKEATGDNSGKYKGKVRKGEDYKTPDLGHVIDKISGPRIEPQKLRRLISFARLYGSSDEYIAGALGVRLNLIQELGDEEISIRSKEEYLGLLVNYEQIRSKKINLIQRLRQISLRISVDEEISGSEEENLSCIQDAVRLLEGILTPGHNTRPTINAAHAPSEGLLGTIGPNNAHPLDPWVGRRLSLDRGAFTVIEVNPSHDGPNAMFRVKLQAMNGDTITSIWRRSWVATESEIGFFASMTRVLCEHDYQSQPNPEGESQWSCVVCTHTIKRPPDVILLKWDRPSDLNELERLGEGIDPGMREALEGWYYYEILSGLLTGPFSNKVEAIRALRKELVEEYT